MENEELIEEILELITENQRQEYVNGYGNAILWYPDLSDDRFSYSTWYAFGYWQGHIKANELRLMKLLLK